MNCQRSIFFFFLINNSDLTEKKKRKRRMCGVEVHLVFRNVVVKGQIFCCFLSSA
jgi:hypothetical protein